MKVLFVGSNPDDQHSLNLEREITELQVRAADAVGEEVSFVFLPKLAVEDLHGALSKHRPDVLHVAAHANPAFLSLANEAGKAVAITSGALRAFLPSDKPPRLVYLSGCNSQKLAAELTKTVPMAIGTTAAITNRAARAGAVVFYEKILAGDTVAAAFEAGKEMIAAIDAQSVKSVLAVRPGTDPTKEVLQRAPRLVADVTAVDRKRELCTVRFGLEGCPANTIQLVFFTDDLSFDEEEEDLASDMCVVTLGSPVGGAMWADEDDEWTIYGDFRLFVVGVTGAGRTFSVGSTLCDAVEMRYRLAGAIPDRKLSETLSWLRGNNGGNALRASIPKPIEPKAIAASKPRKSKRVATGEAGVKKTKAKPKGQPKRGPDPNAKI